MSFGHAQADTQSDDSIWSSKPVEPAPDPAVDGAIEDYAKSTVVSGPHVERHDRITVKKGQKATTDESASGFGHEDKGVEGTWTRSKETEYRPRVAKKDTTSTGLEVGAGRGVISRSTRTDSTVGERQVGSGRSSRLGWDDCVVAESASATKIKDAHGSIEESRKLGVEAGALKLDRGREEVTKQKLDGKEVSTKGSSSKGLGVGKDGALVTWGGATERSEAGKTDAASRNTKLGVAGGHIVA